MSLRNAAGDQFADLDRQIVLLVADGQTLATVANIIGHGLTRASVEAILRATLELGARDEILDNAAIASTRILELIERSSLGSRDASEVRERTPADVVDRIMEKHCSQRCEEGYKDLALDLLCDHGLIESRGGAEVHRLALELLERYGLGSNASSASAELSESLATADVEFALGDVAESSASKGMEPVPDSRSLSQQHSAGVSPEVHQLLMDSVLSSARPIVDRRVPPPSSTSGHAKLLRHLTPERGNVFFAMPYGTREVVSDLGTEAFDFDAFYRDVLVNTTREVGMTPVRPGSIYDKKGLLEEIWSAVQRAEVVVVDFTSRSPNVAMEYAFAEVLGKRMILLSQNPNDIPADPRATYTYITYSAMYSDIHRLKLELATELGGLLEAIVKEPSNEMMLVPMPGNGTNRVTATVIVVEREYAVVRSVDGRHGVLSNADVDYRRIMPDMRKRFSVGDTLKGSFQAQLDGGQKYTLLADQVNPWPRLATELREGTTVTGQVTATVGGVGSFVELADGINGLLSDQLPTGTEVEAVVTNFDQDRRRIGLRLQHVVGHVKKAGDLPAVGERHFGEVVKAVPEQEGRRGGYILVKLPDQQRPALLHASKMTAELRHDLNSNEVDIGEILLVEVNQVDTLRNKILLQEVPETVDDSAKDVDDSTEDAQVSSPCPA